MACGFKRISLAHFASALITSNVALLKLAETAATTPEDWRDPIKASRMMEILTNPANSRIGQLIDFRRNYHPNLKSSMTLIHLLRWLYAVSSSSNNIDAAKPRDRIFGILGLASDTDKLGIRPDYSGTCEQVYTTTARALLHHGHTDILAFSQFPKHYSDLPTWVPDWTANIQVPCGGCVADACFNASARRSLCSPSLSDLPDGTRLLGLHGCRVDKIIEVGTLWEPNVVGWRYDWDQSITFISEIETFCDQSDHLAYSIYKSQEQRKEAVWRIPCGDMDELGNLGRSRARSTGPDVFEGFKLLKSGFYSVEARGSHELRLRSYRLSIGAMFKRRPFLSEQGYVGPVPSHTEVGDVIVITYGAIVPFTIRDLGNGRCQLVGEAYVHGIMDGEYVDKACPQTETFILC